MSDEQEKLLDQKRTGDAYGDQLGDALDEPHLLHLPRESTASLARLRIPPLAR